MSNGGVERMAETVNFFIPKLVEMHNYMGNNSLEGKKTNWKTLNHK